MPRIGLARWILSWVTKPLVAARQSFERIFGIVKGAAPGITQSQVAGAYRAAEKALNLQPTIESMNRTTPWEIGLMGEEKLGAPRRYLVQFDVLIRDPETRKRATVTRNMYFNERLSAGEYEQAFLGSRMGLTEAYEEEILGAEAVNVLHYSGMEY